jgi:hypothetical protein
MPLELDRMKWYLDREPRVSTRVHFELLILNQG